MQVHAKLINDCEIIFSSYVKGYVASKCILRLLKFFEDKDIWNFSQISNPILKLLFTTENL